MVSVFAKPNVTHHWYVEIFAACSVDVLRRFNEIDTTNCAVVIPSMDGSSLFYVAFSSLLGRKEAEPLVKQILGERSHKLTLSGVTV